MDGSVKDDIDSLGLAPDEPRVYHCRNLACQWTGDTPRNTERQIGPRKIPEIRCPECFNWIEIGRSAASAEVLVEGGAEFSGPDPLPAEEKWPHLALLRHASVADVADDADAADADFTEETG